MKLLHSHTGNKSEMKLVPSLLLFLMVFAYIALEYCLCFIFSIKDLISAGHSCACFNCNTWEAEA